MCAVRLKGVLERYYSPVLRCSIVLDTHTHSFLASIELSAESPYKPLSHSEHVD